MYLLQSLRLILAHPWLDAPMLVLSTPKGQFVPALSGLIAKLVANILVSSDSQVYQSFVHSNGPVHRTPSDGDAVVALERFHNPIRGIVKRRDRAQDRVVYRIALNRRL
ncbi:hypothetical protein OE88DRAFT_718141 [Heliocybe sulcata]|uniref:Uncharacterized protein n=1 Tax=Heliocybe sulcata TaxID=5364 RepID=A0A5C3NJ97_9AGAM|nr:hypothetical protein OE88DRAFT_718141 [Heliocybe sulcata]